LDSSGNSGTISCYPKILEMCSGFEICYPKYSLGVWFLGYSGSVFMPGAHEQGVTPRVTKILIKLLKLQLSLKARTNQAVEVANQNLNYQDFKFEVSKC
jgi:hypothetical protein